MTAAVAAPPRIPASAAVAGLAGIGVLLARPWLVRGPVDPTAILIFAFVCVGVVGAWWPLPPGHRSVAAWPATALVTVAGIGCFALGRLIVGDTPAAPALLSYMVLNSLAAVAEEAFFRRLVYDLLSGYGPFLAVVGSAASFTLIHITVWGVWVLPLDLAAGLLLSWQRWATGRWSVPAVTHVSANLLAVL